MRLFQAMGFICFFVVFCFAYKSLAYSRDDSQTKNTTEYQNYSATAVPFAIPVLSQEEADKENKQEKHIDKSKKRILIAPSWQEANILDSCIDTILSSLFGKGYQIDHRQTSSRVQETLYGQDERDDRTI